MPLSPGLVRQRQVGLSEIEASLEQGVLGKLELQGDPMSNKTKHTKSFKVSVHQKISLRKLIDEVKPGW